MLDRKIGTLEFDRSTLGELLQGREPERTISFGAWLDQAVYSGRATAVWSLDQLGNHGFLPSLLVGSDGVIADLLAWSAAFLQGSGPLSGIMRVMTVTELRGLLEGRPRIELRVETLAPLIAICAGELLARRGAAANEQHLSAQAVSNTLSYSLIRAQFVAPQLERDEIVRRWKAVQGSQIEQWHDRITDLVIELTDEAVRRLLPHDRWHGDALYRSRFDFAEPKDLAMSSLRQLLPASMRRIVPEVFWDEPERLSAEQLVDILDEMGPALERAPDGSASERAKVLASVISRTNPEIDNQLELARPMLDSLPEIGLWLTTGMAEQTPGKLLSANKGAGWKLAARLTSLLDPLSLPSAEVAWQESQLGGSATDVIGQKRDSYRVVEIYPGHSISRPQVSAATPVEPTKRSSRGRSARTKGYSPHEVLERAEQNLEEALHALQSLRRGRY
jgi:hypothetical protein